MSAQKVLEFAKSKLGYQEGKGNDNIFGAWYGMNHQPWCAMFLSWCFNQAGEGEAVKISTPKGFAYCPSALAFYKTHNQLVPVAKAQAGDIAFYCWDKTGVPAHAALVVSNDGKHTLTDYEGNTSGESHIGGSQANGDGVYLRHRDYSLVLAVARPKFKVVVAPKPLVVPAPVVPKPISTP